MRNIKKGDTVICLSSPVWEENLIIGERYRVDFIDYCDNFIRVVYPNGRQMGFSLFRFELPTSYITLSKYLSS